jgi:membrane protein
MGWRLYFDLVKRAAVAWVDDRAPSMGAALAFYSAFSLAPLLIIVIAVAGAVFAARPIYRTEFPHLKTTIRQRPYVPI